jgi:Na+/H+ antiporter
VHYGPEFTVVFLASLIFLIGAATRLLAGRTRIPYTIAMLLAGAVVGLVIRYVPGVAESTWSELLRRGAALRPELILLVFLPALVFESAYAIEVHDLRKNLGAVVVLAIPVLVVTAFATAGLMMVLTRGSWDWGFGPAIVFGVLISATDPVAVVAILRELGVSKRLGVVIEGESLLNDGTAIVLFTLVLGLLTGEVAQLEAGSAVLRFLWVASGGLVIGLALAWAISRWIGALFNDPLSEITLTLVLAYAAMLVAESLRVSGVMAVVASGLWMSSDGRTRVSPEVAHFLHRFWATLGYLANTLIFFLVGLIIAVEIGAASATDLILIAGTFVAVMAVRFALNWASQPLLHRWSEGLSFGDCTVLSWGGLRGAVSLALALLVAHDTRVDEDLRHQILLVTAGVVFLSILVNGGTMGRLLSWLGYDRLSLGEQLGLLTVRAHAIDRVRRSLVEVSRSRHLRAVSWQHVTANVDERRHNLEQEIVALRNQLASEPARERAAGHWRRVLAIERHAYWQAHADGTLGAEAVTRLSHDIDRQLDRIDRGRLEPTASRAAAAHGGWRARRRRLLPDAQKVGFERLALLYDLARAESQAAELVLESLEDSTGIDEETLRVLRDAYRESLRRSKEWIEDARAHLPEVATAIESRLASRIELNLERGAFEALAHLGELDESAARQELERIDHRMHRLRNAPTRVDLPSTAELVAATPLFEALDPETRTELAALTEEVIVPAGERLFAEGDRGDSLYVVARGAVHVLKRVGDEDVLIDVLGGGELLGEMALLTGAPRSATARAATSLTVGRIDRAGFDRLLESHPTLREQVWHAFRRRAFDNAVRVLPSHRHLSRVQRLAWIDSARVALLRSGSLARVAAEDRYLFVVSGEVTIADSSLRGTAFVPIAAGMLVRAVAESQVAFLPSAETVLASEGIAVKLAPAEVQ